MSAVEGGEADDDNDDDDDVEDVALDKAVIGTEVRVVADEYTAIRVVSVD